MAIVRLTTDAGACGLELMLFDRGATDLGQGRGCVVGALRPRGQRPQSAKPLMSCASAWLSSSECPHTYTLWVQAPFDAQIPNSLRERPCIAVDAIQHVGEATGMRPRIMHRRQRMCSLSARGP